MAAPALDGPLVHRQTGQLTLIFDVDIHRKYGLLKPEISCLDVSRSSPPSLETILRHMESELKMNGNGGQLLLKALCNKTSAQNKHLQTTPSPVAKRKRKSSSSTSEWKLSGVVPLVCQQIWSNIVLGYPEATLTILVNQHAPQVRVHTQSCMARFFKRELKYLDIVTFFPTKSLKAKHIMGLCQDIFERGVRVKQELRRGVWLHLVGVFHPQLQGRDERERYMAKLRMVYDHLKGKIMGESSDLQEKEQLVDAVHRDAIRTDPNNPFFADYRRPEESYISQHYHQTSDDSNIQKLINIVVIYTLEHPNISYTQGMTDILSPILYIMKNEADAYICFAAMVERIKQHFNQWCTGTLLKLERLRHLCEVLDPKLYACLSANIEEDAFALFFGMVLIECRREFSFEDSFHLLETIWAAVTCSQNTYPSSSSLSNAEWANYMTYHSPEVLQQVFDESGQPYRAIPLPHTMSGSYSYYPYSRNPSLLMSQSPPVFTRKQSEIDPPRVIMENRDSSPIPTPLGINQSNSSIDILQHRHAGNSEQEASQSRARSQSDSNLKSSQNHLSSKSPGHVSSGSPRNGVTNSHKLGNSSFSHSESELYDSFSNSKIMVNSKLSRHPTEMSDMSSISSGTMSANGNLLSSMRSTRNGTPDSATGISRARHHSRTSASMERGSSSGMENGGSKGRASSSVVSDTADSDSASSLKFKDALPYLPPVGVAEPPSRVMLEPDISSPDIKGSQDTVVASNRSPNVVVGDDAPTPLSSMTGKTAREREGGVVTHREYTDPKTGANYVSTIAEVHVDGQREVDLDLSEDEDPVQISQLQQVFEHNGMITSVGHKSPLVFHRPAGAKSKQSVSDGEIIHRRKMLSSPKRLLRAHSPTDHSNTSSPAHESSHRVTPVAFFDAIEKLAESAPGSGAQFPSSFTSRAFAAERESERGACREMKEEEEEEEEEEEGEDGVPTYCHNRRRANSDAGISMILSQLVSTEEGAPRVSNRDSLAIPFSQCYSLFVCLSILVQNRHKIIRSNADFYQLSMILNSQAAKQDLDKTLQIAHQLFRVYRRYQEMCFGPDGNYENWLDNPDLDNP